MAQTRTHVLKLRLDDAELALIDKLCSEHLLDRPSLLRMLIARERRQLFGAAPPAKKDSR